MKKILFAIKYKICIRNKFKNLILFLYLIYMKKIFWLFIIVGFLFLWQITLAQTLTPIVNDIPSWKIITDNDRAMLDECEKGWWSRDDSAWKCNRKGAPAVQWIRMNESCLLNGQCSFNIYEFLGIRKSISDNNSPELFVQDILLSATFFIGTVVTIALIVSWLMFIFAGASGKDPTTAKAGIKNSLIGLLIVVCSYSIIRVVQYIAKWL